MAAAHSRHLLSHRALPHNPPIMTFTRNPILKYPPEGVRAQEQLARPKAILLDLDDQLLAA